MSLLVGHQRASPGSGVGFWMQKLQSLTPQRRLPLQSLGTRRQIHTLSRASSIRVGIRVTNEVEG